MVRLSHRLRRDRYVTHTQRPRLYWKANMIEGVSLA
nr:MAG TPA: hypothetical protein [Herelleviridae sp.]